MTRFLRRLAGMMALIAGGAAPAAATGAAADSTPWVKTPQTEVRLVAGADGLGAGGAITLGLHFKLKDGWKVYWRRPGDAGFPPRIDWSESENFKDAEFAWPAPVRFQVLGFQTMGYAKEVVFPIVVRANEPSRPMLLRARLDYLTCDDICIPYSADFEFAVAAGGGRATPHTMLIERFAARVPGDGSAEGLAIEAVETGAFTRIDDQERAGAVRVVASSAVPFVKPDVFIEGPELAFFGLPSARFSEGGRRAVITVPVSLEKDASLERERLRVTLTDGERAAERELLTTAATTVAPPVPVTPLAIILLFALAGGAILNLMPCVLPVLSLKIVGFAALGGQAPARIRASFLATAAGIVVSFLAIALALVALKTAGASVGWGIQFQHPWFIAALAVLATLFAANLWGLFAVPLPGWLGGVAARASGSSDADQRRPTLGGDFITGALATFLATPCSAPFLGTAVGFALAGDAPDILAVFAALGLGMALPYLVCAAVPGFARILPRPGPWMIRLKQVLAFALAATAAWLLTVLAAQQTELHAIVVGALIVAIPAALFWLRPRAGAAAVAMLAAGAIALPVLMPSATLGVEARRPKSNAAFWQPFDPAAIPGLVAAGKVVFVDITADWCITCQVNKVAVLERAPVKALLENERVIAMQGDWTRPDPQIAAYLQSFGRYAIPFDAVYGPGLPDGVALSELLTTGIVLDALASASNGALAAAR